MRTASCRSPPASATRAGAVPPALGLRSWLRSLVRMDRYRAFIEALCGRRSILRGPRVLLVVAARRRRLRPVGTDSLNITCDLPDLLGGHLVAKRRHSLRTAVPDRCEDRHRLWTIIPPPVEQGRADTALPFAVTTLAAKPRIQSLALRQIVGVGFVWLTKREIDLRR